MNPPLEIMVQNDGFLELLVDALSAQGTYIQGFLYADHHVIRDLRKPWANQEIWRRRQNGSDDYDTCHAAMMRQIEIERMRASVERAFAMMRAPWPGQEAAAEQARLAPTSAMEARSSETQSGSAGGDSATAGDGAPA